MITFTDLVYAESRLPVQLAIVFIQGLIWYHFVPYFSANCVKPFIDGKKWKKQWVALNRSQWRDMKVEMNDAQAYDFGADIIGIILQHTLAGMLAVPSVFGLTCFGSPHFLTALACHGALCEAGWEAQDLLTRLYYFFFGTQLQKETSPPSLMRMMLMHHAFGLSLTIPFNMFFRDSKLYHEGIVLLEVAACLATVAQQYGYTLNTKTANGLWQMRGIVSFTFLIMLYSRGIRYVTLGYEVMVMLVDAHTAFFITASIVYVVFGYFNALLINMMWQKTLKYWSAPMMMIASSSDSNKKVLSLRKASSEILKSSPFALRDLVQIDSSKTK